VSYRHELDRLLAALQAAEAVALFMRTVGTPDEVIEGMRTQPWRAGMVAVAATLAHDSEAMGDLEGGTVPIELLGRIDTRGTGARRRPGGARTPPSAVPDTTARLT
jgi:hypothetical protein